MCYPQLDLSETRFKELTGRVGVRVEKDGHGRIRSYYAEPLTDLSNSFHGTNSGERPLSLQLLNIQGMISKQRNKTEMMGKILQLDQPGKICLVTETHLKTHSNSKMLKYIQTLLTSLAKTLLCYSYRVWSRTRKKGVCHLEEMEIFYTIQMKN